MATAHIQDVEKFHIEILSSSASSRDGQIQFTDADNIERTCSFQIDEIEDNYFDLNKSGDGLGGSLYIFDVSIDGQSVLKLSRGYFLNDDGEWADPNGAFGHSSAAAELASSCKEIDIDFDGEAYKLINEINELIESEIVFDGETDFERFTERFESAEVVFSPATALGGWSFYICKDENGHFIFVDRNSSEIKLVELDEEDFEEMMEGLSDINDSAREVEFISEFMNSNC